MEEDTGNGVGVQEKTGRAATEADSRTSRKTGRRRTAKTLSAADALQILQESLRVARASGLKIEHGPLPQEDSGDPAYGIILHGVSLCQDCNNLHLEQSCPYCTEPNQEV